MHAAKCLRKAAVNALIPIGLAWILISSLQNRFYPSAAPAYSRPHGTFGAQTLVVKLPGTSAGIEEPLLSVGRAGNATFVYIRLLPNSRAQIGIEFWGVGATESAAFDLPYQDGQITVEASFPALFPDRNDPQWGATTEAEKTRLESRFVISVDGVVRTKGTTHYVQPTNSPVYLGTNPLGGSSVSDRFTGKILADWREY